MDDAHDPHPDTRSKEPIDVTEFEPAIFESTARALRHDLRFGFLWRPACRVFVDPGDCDLSRHTHDSTPKNSFSALANASGCSVGIIWAAPTTP